MSSSASPAPTSDGQLLGDFEVAITGGVWVAAGVQHAYRIYPVLVQRYDAEAALRQRINALAQRKHTQARNVCDIQLLLDGGAGKTPFTPQMRAISATEVERALEIGFRRSRRTGDGVSG
jgi:hypothetical protein